jgi:hypothetical protein
VEYFFKFLTYYVVTGALKNFSNNYLIEVKTIKFNPKIDVFAENIVSIKELELSNILPNQIHTTSMEIAYKN